MKIQEICKLFGFILFFYLLLKLISDVCFKKEKKIIEYFGTCTPTTDAPADTNCPMVDDITVYPTIEDASNACQSVSNCEFTATPDPDPSTGGNTVTDPSAEEVTDPSTGGNTVTDPSAEEVTDPSTGGNAVTDPSAEEVTDPSTGGNTVTDPSTEEVTDPSTGGNTVTDPSTEEVTDPSIGGNTVTDPSTGGNTVTDPSTGGNTVTDPSTGGNTVTDPSTEEVTDPSTGGNAVTDPSAEEVTDPSTGGNTVTDPSAEEVTDPSTGGNSTSGACVHPSDFQNRPGYDIDLTNIGSGLDIDSFDLSSVISCSNGYTGTPDITPCTGNGEPYDFTGCVEINTTGKCSEVECEWPERHIRDAENVDGTTSDVCCEKTGLCSGNDGINDYDGRAEGHTCYPGTWVRYNATSWPKKCPDDNSIAFPQCYSPIEDPGNPGVFLEPTLYNLADAYAANMEQTGSHPHLTTQEERLSQAKNDICCIDSNQHNYIERIYGSQINIGRALEIENEISTNTAMDEDTKRSKRNQSLEILYEGLQSNQNNSTIIDIIQNMTPLDGQPEYGSGYCKGNIPNDTDVTCSDSQVPYPFITEGTNESQCCQGEDEGQGEGTCSSINCPNGMVLKEDTINNTVSTDGINECCENIMKCSDINVQCSVNPPQGIRSDNIINNVNMCEFTPGDSTSCPENCEYTAEPESCINTEGLKQDCCVDFNKCIENENPSLDHNCTSGLLKAGANEIYIEQLDASNFSKDSICCDREIQNIESEDQVEAELTVNVVDVDLTDQVQRANFLVEATEGIADALGVDSSLIQINELDGESIDQVEIVEETGPPIGELPGDLPIVERMGNDGDVSIVWVYLPPDDGSQVLDTATIERVFSEPGVQISSGIATTQPIQNVQVIKKEDTSNLLMYSIIAILVIIFILIIFLFGIGGIFISKKK
jgi:hypothetical protein